MILTSNRFQR